MKSFADGRDSSDLIAGCNSPANKAIPGDHPAAEQIMRFFFFFFLGQMANTWPGWQGERADVAGQHYYY